jgi:hypothetical protein
VAYGGGGGGGAAGSPGPAGKNAFTITSGAFTVPAVGSTVTVTVSDASFAVVGEMLAIGNAGGGGNAGALQIQSIAGNQLTLVNPAAPPAIPPADSTQAGLLKQLSGAATDYVGGDNACHALPSASGFISKTANYGLTSADSGKYVLCSGGSWQLTLPTPVAGLNYRVRNDQGITGTTGTITLAPSGGMIDNLASLALLPQQDCAILTDGTNWRTFGLKREVILGTQDITSATASGTVLLPAGFRLFTLDFTGLQSSVADASFVFQISFDGGTTWQTAGYYTQLLTNTSATVAGTVSYNAAVQSYLGTFTASAPYGMASLKLHPGGATINANWLADATYWYVTGAFVQKYQYGGFTSSNGLVTALKYYPSSGNIVNIHLTVKGIV